MKDRPHIQVKLLRTIRNGNGDVFRKGSKVKARKMYGGYEIIKNKRRADGRIIAVTRVQERSFQIINL